jgi:hypothetical protein
LKNIFVSPLQLVNAFGSVFNIGEVDLKILDFGVDAVAKICREKVVDENELAKLRSEIQDLYEHISELEIDKHLKTVWLDMLKIMENAVHEYRIRGVERLREAVEQLIGIWFFSKEEIENSDIEEVGKVRIILDKFTNLWAFAADTVQLLEAGSKYLPLLLVAAEKISK